MLISEGAQVGLIMLGGALAFAAVIGHCVKNNTSIFKMVGLKRKS
jgi:hypothetical protein